MNLLLHATYLFGLIPEYAYRTPLPDWSLSLEMQFYAVFPFIVVLARRIGWLPASVTVFCIGTVLALATSAAGLHYPVPTFLPLKLHLFLAGMLVAQDPRGDRRRLTMQFALAVLLAALPFGPVGTFSTGRFAELLVVGIFGLVHWQSIGIVGWASRLLGSRPMYWLASSPTELIWSTCSSCTRLLPGRFDISGRACGRRRGSRSSSCSRRGISYALAFVGYTFIERPGQALGRNLLRLVGRQCGAIQTPAEEIAAP
ncbi:MAG: hypothetical protein WDO13_01465 [Verrucomicrobiota bacterium]